MKKRKVHFQLSIFNFQLLIAIALAFASCADKDTALPAGARGVSVNVTLPDDGSLSRSVPSAPAGYALRCVLEARTKEGSILKARVEQIAEGTSSLSLKFDLEAAGEYVILLWADYIAEDATPADATLDDVAFRHYPDKYYKTDDIDGLRHVSVLPYSGTYTTPDVRDAFTGTVAFTKGGVAVTDLSVSLTRPLSRLTIAEKNDANFALCSTVTATYKVPAAIDALTGNLIPGEQTEVTLSGTPSPDATVTVGGTACHVLLSDLVLATADGTMGTIDLTFTPTPDADKYLPPLTLPAGVPAIRAFRINAAGNLIAPTEPLSRVILAVDIDDSWGTPDVETILLQIPDENFRKFCIARGYADADGIINPAEAAKVTGLDVSDKRIASLEGIDKFVNLEYLSCGENNLTSLDISKFTALKLLNCAQSYSITVLDVSKCTKLQTLKCSSSSLTELDVSKCTELTYLDCHGNKLTALDMSKCTELQTLTCSSSSLTELDVSKCTELTYLSCNGNKLAELDVSKCTELTYLSCNGNQLAELDVSMTLKTNAYWLYCGNQKTNDGKDQPLILTLATGQTTRWDAIKEDYNNQNVTLKP